MNTTLKTPDDLQSTVKRALEEDIGSGDITAALIDTATTARASIISRENAVICGIPWADEVIHQLDRSNITLEWLCHEGSDVKAGQTIARFNGPARTLLSAER
ncbi:MAG: nicotinate-nucleotide diphosphorylase (carboxylating), partial [Pseudohongiella sp.]